MNNEELEKEIQKKNLTAPRLTPDQIVGKISHELYYRFIGTTTTVCCLVLENGYTVVGHSACVSPENFDEMLGRSIAKEDALKEIWSLEGYLLRQKLFESGGGDG